MRLCFVHMCLCLCAVRACALHVPASAPVSVSVLQQVCTADSSHGTSGNINRAMELHGHSMPAPRMPQATGRPTLSALPPPLSLFLPFPPAPSVLAR